ncbi:ribonucleotide reductase of class III (anaerobic), large subunit [Vibrio phage JSF2]|nr:ribonucleotide reductase of class III (anaerobic), large subunit [Vibrio phage JSF1]ASV41975.1 ribonucleotide reductase of class III (anaerobic), large subunit [Vibrio phage JSF2]
MKVVKRDGIKQDFDIKKIFNAVSKSATRCNITLSEVDLVELEFLILDEVCGDIEVKELHNTVEKCLSRIDPEVADSYKQYRNYKQDFVGLWDKIYNKTKDVLYAGDRENSNFESTLVSTKGSLVKGYLAKELYTKFFLSKEEKEATDIGFIYQHDQRDLIFNGINCCLFDMANVLNGGFEMSNLKYNEPSSILSALQVIGDVTLATSSQGFGGFTVPEIDTIAIKYMKKSVDKLRDEAKSFGIKDEEHYVFTKLQQELNQGIQSLEMKLNSIPSSRGDFAFTTFSFGALSEEPYDRKLQKMFCETLLNIRMKGNGNGEPVVFPKLVFLFLKSQYDKYQDYRDLFSLAIKCSSKSLYPDYLAVDTQGQVAEYYKSSGKIVSPMGCRAYLSDFKGKNGESVFTSRANIGAVALNLPMIWKESDGKNFYEDLDYYLEMIRNLHKKRYDTLAKTKCSSNPMAFCQGGLYLGNKKPTDNIGYDIVKSFTASFGVTALNELNVLKEGLPLHKSDRLFVNEVMGYINKKVEDFKAEDGYLYAVYYVPAESLCGTQLQQFRKRFGVIKGVSDREYFSNGFHLHVTADVTPFEKQDMEYELFHKGNGGHIQYCRYNNPANLEAIEATVLRAMDMGFYEGVNFELVVCEDCGHRPKHEVDICPVCNSHNIMSLSRACGYISYKKIHGDTRFNDAKLAEINDRVSM